MEWISVKDRLPETSMKDIIFVIYTPSWHNLTDDFPEDERDFPENIETVSGWIDVYCNGKVRYWNWISYDGNRYGYQATIENEYSEEETGRITYITHWMPLPEPPKENIE